MSKPCETSVEAGAHAGHMYRMFTVDEATADAIRRAYEESGELAGVVEFRRHFPLIDSAHAWDCVRVIVRWGA